jgi:hypothetical protein
MMTMKATPLAPYVCRNTGAPRARVLGKVRIRMHVIVVAALPIPMAT